MFNLIKFIMILVLLPSCGSDSQQQGDNPQFPQGTIERNAGNPDDKQVVVEHRRINDQYAIAVKDTENLPECELINDRQLAYVKNADTFYSCNDQIWAPIDIEGPRGEKGEKGEKGESVPLAENLWYDAITGLTWFIGGEAMYYSLEDGSACGEDFQAPDYEVLKLAIIHGLAEKAANVSPNVDYAWTTSVANTYPDTHKIAIELPGTIGREKAKSSYLGIFCYQN